MGRYVIDVRARSSAPREAVWQLLADGRSWSDWAPWQRSELEQEGSPPPDGVGAVKRLIRWPTVTRERVTAFEPERRLAYEMMSGLPLRGYQAEVTLTEAEGGTEIRWHSEFDGAKIPGTASLFRWMLHRFIADVAKRLAREAERRQG